MALPPGSLGLPLIGDTLNFLQDSQFAKKRHQQYGPIFKTSIFGQPTVFMRGQEASLFVLSNDNQYFVATFPPSMKALLGPLSLALQTGANHKIGASCCTKRLGRELWLATSARWKISLSAIWKNGKKWKP
jgi:hypothetical protein